MDKQLLKRLEAKRQSEAGFTLVELAIVMIIIGLLIGGVLKGQELIANAEVSSTVAQIKNIDAGVNTFRDSYQNIPGDLPRAAARIPNCAACAAGNGNGRLDSAGTTIAAVDAAAPAGEALEFWRQMNAADMVAGVDGSLSITEWGTGQPSTPVGGGLTVGFTATGAAGAAAGLPGSSGAGRAGHYLTLRLTPNAASADDVLTPSQAFRLDDKIDNGSPNTGTAIASGTASEAGCFNNATAAAIYNEALGGNLCGIMIRIQ